LCAPDHSKEIRLPHAAGICLADGSENPAVQSIRESVSVGEWVGERVGELVGELVGDLVDGASVVVGDEPLLATGLAEGTLVGERVGALVGALVGVLVGMGAGGVGEDPQPPTRILIGFLMGLAAERGAAVARLITSATPRRSLTSMA